jgi:hypothetical protein
MKARYTKASVLKTARLIDGSNHNEELHYLDLTMHVRCVQRPTQSSEQNV